MPDDPARSRRWSLRADPRSAVRTAVVWDVLDALVGERAAAVANSSVANSSGGNSSGGNSSVGNSSGVAGQGKVLDVVDVGGGTGGFAVPLARLGHHVTVVDPSPDALAALARRAAEADVADRVHPLQGDAGALVPLVGAQAADVVLCHGVLEYADDPRAGVHDAVEVLRPGGLLSILVAQRLGAVLARALSGRFDDARRLLDDPDGRAGDADPLPRRFDEAGLREILDGEPVTLRARHGVRLFADLLPGALVDGDPDAAQALLDLERAAGDHLAYPELTAIAAQLHLVVQRLA